MARTPQVRAAETRAIRKRNAILNLKKDNQSDYDFIAKHEQTGDPYVQEGIDAAKARIAARKNS
jgi:hypothetical protein